jgi:hypothetical protein
MIFLKYFWMSDKESANCRSLPLMSLKMVFRFKLWMEKIRWNDLEHCSSWEDWRRNFEPLTESDGSFFVDRHAPSRVWRKRTNPIRSECHVVQARPHLMKTCPLSSETLQTNPHSQKKKSRDKKLWCHSSAILRPWRFSFDQLNWKEFFLWPSSSGRFRFSFIIFFVQIRGVQPATHEPEFFCAAQTLSRIFRHFDHFPSVFFLTDCGQNHGKKVNCGSEKNFGLNAPGLDCERWNHRFWRRTLSAVSWNWWKIIVSLAMGCPVGRA